MKLDWKLAAPASSQKVWFLDETLVEFNGPQIILLQDDDSRPYLSLAVDEDEFTRWLVAPTSVLEVLALRLGATTLRAAVQKPIVFVCDMRDDEVLRYWEMSTDQLPEGAMPEYGESLAQLTPMEMPHWRARDESGLTFFATAERAHLSVLEGDRVWPSYFLTAAALHDLVVIAQALLGVFGQDAGRDPTVVIRRISTDVQFAQLQVAVPNMPQSELESRVRALALTLQTLSETGELVDPLDRLTGDVALAASRSELEFLVTSQDAAYYLNYHHLTNAFRDVAGTERSGPEVHVPDLGRYRSHLTYDLAYDEAAYALFLSVKRYLTRALDEFCGRYGGFEARLDEASVDHIRCHIYVFGRRLVSASIWVGRPVGSERTAVLISQPAWYPAESPVGFDECIVPVVHDERILFAVLRTGRAGPSPRALRDEDAVCSYVFLQLIGRVKDYAPK